MESRRPEPAVLAAFGGIVLFLGSNFVAVRISNQELDPTWGATLRFALAALLLLAVVTARRIPLPKGKALAGAALFGLLAFAANFGLLYWALRPGGITAGTAAVIFATIPLTTILAASAIGLERLRPAGLVGAVLAAGGVAWMFAGATGAGSLPSVVAAVLASIAAALSGIVVKAFPKSHPLALNAVAMAIASVCLYGAARWLGDERVLPTAGATWAALAWLVLSSAVAFAMMVWVIVRWTASASSYAAVLAPLVTVPVAAALAGEGVGAAFLAGAVLVLGGSYIGALRRSPPAAPAGKLAQAPPPPSGSGPGPASGPAPSAPPKQPG